MEAAVSGVNEADFTRPSFYRPPDWLLELLLPVAVLPGAAESGAYQYPLMAGTRW